MIIFFFLFLIKEKENYLKTFIVYFFINSTFKCAINLHDYKFSRKFNTIKKKDNVKTVYFTLLFFYILELNICCCILFY